MQHVQLVCEALINSKHFERLERFLWALPPGKQFDQTEIVVIAKAFLAFKERKFQRLYQLLQSNAFSKRYHRQLQILWRSAHYMEAELQRGRPLGAVGKYRIRRKYPLPKTIWDGENMSYCFQDGARDILNEAYAKTIYPTATEKLTLAEKANLTVTQVSNWFKNKRQRARANKGKNDKLTFTPDEENRRRGFSFSNDVTKHIKPIVLQPRPISLQTLYNARRQYPTIYRQYPPLIPIGHKSQPIPLSSHKAFIQNHNRLRATEEYFHQNKVESHVKYVPCTCNMEHSKERFRFSF